MRKKQRNFVFLGQQHARRWSWLCVDNGDDQGDMDGDSQGDMDVLAGSDIDKRT